MPLDAEKNGFKQPLKLISEDCPWSEGLFAAYTRDPQSTLVDDPHVLRRNVREGNVVPGFVQVGANRPPYRAGSDDCDQRIPQVVYPSLTKHREPVPEGTFDLRELVEDAVSATHQQREVLVIRVAPRLRQEQIVYGQKQRHGRLS